MRAQAHASRTRLRAGGGGDRGARRDGARGGRAYRALYLLNWVYRWLHEPGYRHWIVWISGTVQTIFYVDFFYYYVKSWRNNEKLKLPN